MVILTALFFILYFSLPSLKNLLTSVMVRRINAIAFIYAGVLAFNTLYIQSIGSGIGIYSGLFKVNIISNFIAFFILLISSIIIIIWPNLNFQSKYSIKYLTTYNNIDNNLKSNEFNLIILFNILGALFLISSSDLVSMYLSIELQSFGLYVLTTLYKEKYSSTSAGLKYFLLGGLSSCIILLGSGLIYNYTGLTNLESIYNLVSVYLFSPLASELKGISLGILFIFSGFLFKIAASPFHNWAPGRELGKFSNIG